MISLYWVALKTIWIKEVTRFGRIWVQTLLPPVITMSLYFVIFGNLIGSRIGDMGGVDYMQFIVPGLIMMAVITNSYSNVCSSFFGSKFQKNIEELLVAPVPTHIIIAGFVGGGGCKRDFSWLLGYFSITIFYSITGSLMGYGHSDTSINCNCVFISWVIECYFCQDI